MKINKPDAALLWKQIDDELVPRLGLNLTERVVYASLLRHSRVEGKPQLRFTIPCFSRSVRLANRQGIREGKETQTRQRPILAGGRALIPKGVSR
jgi:hypothetical protein